MKMTIGEYIKIVNDIDGYIARGGKLLELEMSPDLSSLPPQAQNVLETGIDPAAAARVAAFFEAVGNEHPTKGARIGEVITEKRLQEIWRGTAKAPAPKTR
jgi:hypothetical protein